MGCYATQSGFCTQKKMSTILLVFFFLLILSLIIPLKPPRTQKRGVLGAITLPPSPPQLPIIGNLHQVGKLHHHSLWKLSQKYGPAMLLKLGNTPTLVISSARMAREVLQVHDLDFCSRPSLPASKQMFYDQQDVVFSPYGDHWREMRKAFVSLLMNSKRQQSFWDARVAEVEHLITSLTHSSEKPVNLEEKLFSLVDGVIGAAAFGKSYRGKQFSGQKLKDVLVEVMDTLNGTSVEDFFPSAGWIIDFIAGHRRKVQNCFRKIDGYLERVLDEHLDPNRQREDCEDLVDSLIKYSKQENHFHFTREHMKAILMNTFLGGVDTSAITLVWAMAELIKNPRVMEKLQAEIRSSIGKKPRIGSDDLSKLPYLKMVVKETFRMHPAAPLLVPHESTRHCKISDSENGGFDVPAKTRVLVNVWGIGRDPSSWKKPNEFWPERFAENEIDFTGKHFELLPFGAGRRSCPGVAASVLTIEYTLANVLYWFNWEMAPGKKVLDLDMEEGGGLLCHKKTPLVLVPIKHDWL